MATKLTKQLIASIKPALSRDKWLTDSAARNLRLKVTPKGAKIFVLDYYNRAGKQKRLRLGDAATMDPAIARKKAREIQTGIDADVFPDDPVAAPDSTNDSPFTIGTMLDAYARQYLAKLRTGGKTSRRIIDHCLQHSHLATYRPEAVDGPTLIQEFDRLTLERVGKTKQERDLGPQREPLSDSYRGHARDVLSAAWNWAYKRGATTAPSPCKAVDRYKSKKRARRVTLDQYRKLDVELKKARLQGTRNPFTIMVLEACLYTGFRQGEILNSKVEDLDLDEGSLHIPVHKTVDKDDVDNIRPLSPEAIEVFNRALAERRRRGITIEDSPYIFVSLRGRAPFFKGLRKTPIRSGHQDLWRTIRKKVGMEKFVLHNARSGSINLLIEAGHTCEEISSVTGQDPQTIRRYYMVPMDIKTGRRLATEAGSIIRTAMRNGSS